MTVGELVRPESLEGDVTDSDRPAIAHLGREGWRSDPQGPTALCGARLLGIRVEAGWNYPSLCPECRKQYALLCAKASRT